MDSICSKYWKCISQLYLLAELLLGKQPRPPLRKGRRGRQGRVLVGRELRLHVLVAPTSYDTHKKFFCQKSLLLI